MRKLGGLWLLIAVSLLMPVAGAFGHE